LFLKFEVSSVFLIQCITVDLGPKWVEEQSQRVGVCVCVCVWREAKEKKKKAANWPVPRNEVWRFPIQ
jgi:hypothetical protein